MDPSLVNVTGNNPVSRYLWSHPFRTIPPFPMPVMSQTMAMRIVYSVCAFNPQLHPFISTHSPAYPTWLGPIPLRMILSPHIWLGIRYFRSCRCRFLRATSVVCVMIRSGKQRTLKSISPVSCASFYQVISQNLATTVLWNLTLDVYFCLSKPHDAIQYASRYFVPFQDVTPEIRRSVKVSETLSRFARHLTRRDFPIFMQHFHCSILAGCVGRGQRGTTVTSVWREEGIRKVRTYDRLELPI